MSLDEQPMTYDRFIALPNGKDLVDYYLFGIPFEDDEGNSAKQAIFNHHINAAMSRFEMKFDQPLLKRRFVEPHDYKIQDYTKYSYIQLFHFPVIEVTEIQLQYVRNETIVSFPQEWIRLAGGTGQVQIVPTTAAVSQFIISGSGDLPHIFGAKDYFPQLIFVNYVAGFETDKIPYIIMHWCCIQAAIHMLAIAGDLILGAGIQNTSIGLGGLSQSIGTTKSNKGAFSGRIEMYQKELAELNLEIKRFYKGVKLVTI